MAALMWSVVRVPALYSGFKDSVETLIIERYVPPVIIEGYPSSPLARVGSRELLQLLGIRHLGFRNQKPQLAPVVSLLIDADHVRKLLLYGAY
jgi:hypothetical protein